MTSPEHGAQQECSSTRFCPPGGTSFCRSFSSIMRRLSLAVPAWQFLACQVNLCAQSTGPNREMPPLGPHGSDHEMQVKSHGQKGRLERALEEMDHR